MKKNLPLSAYLISIHKGIVYTETSEILPLQ